MTTAEMMSYIAGLGLTEAEMLALQQSLGQLKAYTFTRRIRTGALQSCYISVDGELGDFTSFKFTISFLNHASLEEKEMGSPADDVPFVLRMSGADFWREALKPIDEADRDKSLLVVLSNIIWRLAFETPFIEDWESIVDGKRVRQLKSLSELNAQEV